MTAPIDAKPDCFLQIGNTEAQRSQALDLMFASLRACGWIICAPGCVPLPRTKDEALAMSLVAANWLEAHP